MLESIYAEITEKCNLACKHCYNCSGRGKTLDMEYSSFTNMIDQMAELGGTSLAISGGELFLHPDINKILYFLSEKKMMKIVLITNGTVVNDDIFDYLQSSPHISLQVSLDGATEEINTKTRGPGSFEKVISFLNKLSHQERRDHALKMTVNRFNMEQVIDFIELAQYYHCTPSFGLIIGLGQAKQDWENIGVLVTDLLRTQVKIDRYAKTHNLDPKRLQLTNPFAPCPIMKKEDLTQLTVKANGDVHVCNFLYDTYFCIGNINRQPLREIISKDNPLTAAIRQSIIARKRLFEANLCKDCYLVNTGCPKDGGCYGLLGTEDLYSPGYTCAIRKKAPVLKEIVQAYSTQ